MSTIYNYICSLWLAFVSFGNIGIESALDVELALRIALFEVRLQFFFAIKMSQLQCRNSRVVFVRTFMSSSLRLHMLLLRPTIEISKSLDQTSHVGCTVLAICVSFSLQYTGSDTPPRHNG